MSDELEAINTRFQKATQGPWRVKQQHGSPCVVYDIHFGMKHIVQGWDPFHAIDSAEYDADFIAHSISDIPYLLAEIARVSAESDARMAENERLREELHAVQNKSVLSVSAAKYDLDVSERRHEIERLSRDLETAIETIRALLHEDTPAVIMAALAILNHLESK